MKKYHTLILLRVWLKTKITQIHALAKTRNHCFDQYILYHQHSYTNSALLQRRILVLGKHVGSKNDERLVWKQLCARNKIFNRLEALHRKPSLSTVFNISSKTKKYICTLTFYEATWLTNRERWFKWVTAIRINLARCAKRGSSLPLSTPMEILILLVHTVEAIGSLIWLSIGAQSSILSWSRAKRLLKLLFFFFLGSYFQ